MFTDRIFSKPATALGVYKYKLQLEWVYIPTEASGLKGTLETITFTSLISLGRN